MAPRASLHAMVAIVALAFVPAIAHAQSAVADDVLKLRDGTVLVGIVDEQHPRVDVRIVTPNGAVRVVRWGDIARATGPSFLTDTLAESDPPPLVPEAPTPPPRHLVSEAYAPSPVMVPRSWMLQPVSTPSNAIVTRGLLGAGMILGGMGIAAFGVYEAEQRGDNAASPAPTIGMAIVTVGVAAVIGAVVMLCSHGRAGS